MTEAVTEMDLVAAIKTIKNYCDNQECESCRWNDICTDIFYERYGDLSEIVEDMFFECSLVEESHKNEVQE